MCGVQQDSLVVAAGEVALVRVVYERLVLVELALDLHARVINGWLEVAVLRINHHSHIALHMHRMSHIAKSR